MSAAEIVWTKPDGTTLTKAQFDAEIQRIEAKLRDGMKAQLEDCRMALTQGRLAQAQRLLDELGASPYLLFETGPELASAESYGIAEDFRQLFQDRIEWVNYCIRYAGEPLAQDGVTTTSSGVNLGVECGPMSNQSVKEESAKEALFLKTREAVVFVMDGRPGPHSDRAANGSGIILITPGGAVLLLTARHVLEDEPPAEGFTLGHWSHPIGIADALSEQWFHPEADVAIARLTDLAADRLRAHAQPTSIVPSSQFLGFSETTTPVLCGCPVGYRTREQHAARGVIRDGYVPLSYFTLFEGIDNGKGHERFKISWGDAVIPSSAFMSHESLVFAPGEVFELTHPQGISGGPLFAVGGSVPKDEIWSASKKLQLVGIASTYREDVKIELCPSVNCWGEWFHQTVGELDDSVG